MTSNFGMPASSVAGAAHGGKSIYEARILIADDEPLCCRLLAGILRRQNFTNLHFAEGGKTAMEQVRASPPDLLLLDMQMPDLSGLEVCRQVRSLPEFVDLPILIQTATVDRKEMGDVFTAGASDFLSKPINPSELVSRVVVHLERRKLLRELREYRERISSELDAARRMQFELLPSPQIQQQLATTAGLRIGSYARSSSEIGGDIWGLLPIDAASFGIFLADFTGHGVTAALNTFRLHALIHEYNALHSDPVGLLSVLNTRLARLLPAGQFATFFYVVIDHAAAELRFASAGAPPAIIKSGLCDPSILAEATGLPLGIAADVRYELHRSPFARDATLLLFSDGLSEFPNLRGHRIEEAGLLKAMDGCHPDLTPHEVIDQLCRSAGITSDDALPDDTTIICIDRRGAGAPCFQNAALVPERTPLLAPHQQQDPQNAEQQPC
jgi:phosphoserine phosphatase RsbU/P